MGSESKTHNMVLTRVFDAPVEQVWKAWSEADQVKKWWGPTGFTCPVADMDFREGGTSLVCMKAPAEYGGMSLYNTWRYTKIVPIERMEFVQNFSDEKGSAIAPGDVGLPAGIPYEVPHTITFKAVGDKRTEITVTEFGYADPQTVEMSKGGMEQCLDKMAASFE
jgi:uncharacterized protein YndB with AHSA1/START domain